MFIIGDTRIPEVAKENLSKWGTFVPFQSAGITYKGISGHPDVFFCRGEGKMVLAPNTPSKYCLLLIRNNIHFYPGNLPVGGAYPETARYNAVVSDDFLIHHKLFTDERVKTIFSFKEFIHVNQAYTRCSLLPLRDNRFITSDKGIYTTLQEEKLRVEYFSPKGIRLPGFGHGFIGGAIGLWEDKAFILGRLKAFPEGERLRKVFQGVGYEICELYDGPLFDGGSLIFLP